MAAERIRSQFSIVQGCPVYPLLDGLTKLERRSLVVSIFQIGAACLMSGHATLAASATKWRSAPGLERIRVQVSIAPGSPAYSLLAGLPKQERRALALSIFQVGAACLTNWNGTLTTGGGEITRQNSSSSPHQAENRSRANSAPYEAGTSSALSQLLSSIDEM